MGVETALFATMALQAGSGIAQGIAAKEAGDEAKKLSESEAALALSEGKREAGRLRLEHKIYNANLKLQFFKRGVAIPGSPENIIASSINLQDEEARAILGRSAKQAQNILQGGLNAQAEGRAALISGIVGGVTSATVTGIQAKSLGFFSGNKIPPVTGTTAPGTTPLSNRQVFSSTTRNFPGSAFRNN